MTFEPPKFLYHWTEADAVDSIRSEGFTNAFLTSADADPKDYWNLSICWLDNPVRVRIDTSLLDSSAFEIDFESLNDYIEGYGNPLDLDPHDCSLETSFEVTENIYYSKAIPVSALLEFKDFRPAESWKRG